MKVEGTDVGKVIKTIRKKKNMSIMEFSEAAGISKSHLEKIELGLCRPEISTFNLARVWPCGCMIERQGI